MRRTRTQTEKAQHAVSERKRYARLRRGLIRGIVLMRDDGGIPYCSMPTGRRYDGKPIICGRTDGPFEIDHEAFSTFVQRRTNSVRRLERFAVEFVQWMGGDRKKKLRIACRSCNAKHQPRKRSR